MVNKLNNMEYSEYKNKLALLKQEFWTKENDLIIEYAMSNNNVQEGDLFRDHIGCIKVERIEATFAGLDATPSCKYYGLEIKTDGTPKKKSNYRWAFQCNKIK